MILPILESNAPESRTPWLTVALLVVFLAAFFAARGENPFFADDARVEIEHAIDFWIGHPYLEPTSHLLDAAMRASGATEPARFVASVRARGALPPVDKGAVLEEQHSLDKLTQLALHGTDAAPGETHPARRFGLVTGDFRAYALVTHAFLHLGWLHLVLSGLLLWLVVPALERRLGVAVVAGVLAAGALAAALVELVLPPRSDAILLGSGGALACAVGAFATRFAGERSRFRWLALRSGRVVVNERAFPSWTPLALLCAAQLVLWLAWHGSTVATGSAFGPDLAALGVGALAALGLARLRLEERFIAPALEARTRGPLDPRLKRAQTARERGKHDEAIALCDAVLRERPDDADALLGSWDAHVAAGRAGDGARSARRLVELYARRGELAPAARIWDALLRVQHRGRVEPTTLLRIVPELVVQARRDAAIAALRAVVDPTNTGLTVGQALRVAELGAELDPPTALAAAHFALERGELVDERRARLETLVRALEGAGGPPTPTAPPPPPLAAESPDETSALADAPAAAPGELFELEPTQLGGELPELEPEPRQQRPPAPGEAMRTVVFAAKGDARGGFETVKAVPALPVALDVGGLRVRLEGGAPSLIEWTRVQAVAVGRVSGLGTKPVVVIDLALNWADDPGEALEVLRLRSDAFRARQLVTGADGALDALRALLAEILARSGAVPLPDAAGARGLPFREFADPASYERQVLLSAS